MGELFNKNFSQSIERIGQARLTTDDEVAEHYIKQVDEIVFKQEHPWLYNESTKEEDGCFPLLIGIIGLTSVNSIEMGQKLIEFLS